MVEFGWIQMYFLLLQITGAQNRQYLLYIFVRVGDEVTLPCENVIGNRCNCDGTTWMFIGPRHTASVELVKLGRTESDPVSKPDRLSLTATCSLVIKKVTDEDVGRYSCRQFDRSGRQRGPDTDVYLSVVTMTEYEDGDKVTLNCSVLTDGRCRYTVKWQLKDVDQDNKDLTTSRSDCSASVSFTTSHFIHMPENYGSLKCEVTDGYTGKVQQFIFSPQTSDWWWYIILAVGLAALLVTGVVLVKLKKNKGNNTQMDENMADPEDGVSYASINHNKNTNSKAQIRGSDDAVTYSTVKTPSSSAGASTDPSNLYATVSKPHE
ncbi:uncharacterized protein LOC108887482 isoform X2 [Lates calcarifer]|uniref:Uncharacterized protein LOC108887482 isoform X2 n=1 Tax=Lates calcarifer TaxID=8187 RepID=A0AAJ8B753_LATCA|nr:uncharacterized protein LOC108887482 isoform X2 [Lates calcarifer]